MRYLLDTCVVSELVASKPNPRVLQFVAGMAEHDVAISCLTIGELRKGIERLSSSRRRAQLEQWLDRDLVARFGPRLLSLDLAVANRWGTLVAQCERAGRVLPVLDSLIAAVALEHGLHVVTRNEADFQGTGVEITNPWR